MAFVNKPYEVTVDRLRSLNNRVEVMKGNKDSIDLKVYVTENRQKVTLDVGTNLRYYLEGSRPDGSIIEVEYTRIENGNCIVFENLPEYVTLVPGQAHCHISEFDLEQNKKFNYTYEFIIYIRNDYVDDDAVLRSHEFSILTDIIIKSNVLIKKVTEIIESYESINNENKQLIDSLNASESIRVTNENERKIAESTRTSSETTRITNENERKTSESTRISNEDTRLSNEDTRLSNENIRKSNESTRELSEIVRVSAEDKRAQNENTRIESENTRISNEDTRIESEDIRKSNEIARMTSETVRNAAESKRIVSENERVELDRQRDSNELIRTTSENERKAEELVRINNENIRDSNESLREVSEVIRIASEDEREQNEDTRISNEDARIESEKSRENNETVRLTSEISRTAAEFEREESEQNRMDNENVRISSENERNITENTRLTNESIRRSNESTRELSEIIRVSAEDERKTSESTRILNENTRIDSEDTRLSNENIRKSNEIARMTSETVRNAAESKRIVSENERQTNTTTAITNANTATNRANTAAKACEDIVINGTGISDTTVDATHAFSNQYVNDNYTNKIEFKNEIDNLKSYVSDKKMSIASAVTDMGQVTASDATFDTIVVNIKNISSDATATEYDVLATKTFYKGGIKRTGNILSKSSATYIPTITDQTINLGQYLSGIQTIKGDSNLIAENIKKGVSIFGIIGTLLGGEIESGDTGATNDTILTGYVGYVNGVKIIGSMSNNGAVTSSLDAGASYTIPKGYHDGTGKITANSLSSQTSATSVASEILSGKTAWINGVKVTGTMTNKSSTTSNLATSWSNDNGDTGVDFLVPQGYYDGSTKIYQTDSNLTPSNIKAGTSIFGVSGTFTSDANATASKILSGYSGYVNGSKINGTMANNGNIPYAGGNGADGTAFDDTTMSTGTGYNASVGAFDISMKQGYISGGSVRLHIPNLIPSNIMAGTKVGWSNSNIAGTATSDANAIADYIVSGYSGYVNGLKVNGNIPNRGMYQAGCSSATLYADRVYLRFPRGYYSGGSFDTNGGSAECYVPYSDLVSLIGLVPGKLLIGESLLGITGTGGCKFASGTNSSYFLTSSLPMQAYYGSNNGGGNVTNFGVVDIVLNFVPNLVIFKNLGTTGSSGNRKGMAVYSTLFEPFSGCDGAITMGDSSDSGVVCIKTSTNYGGSSPFYWGTTCRFAVSQYTGTESVQWYAFKI